MRGRPAARWRSNVAVLAGVVALLGACSSTSSPSVDSVATRSAPALSNSATETLAPPRATAGATGEAADFDAAAACAAIAPDTATAVDALATTVGEVRAYAAGPPTTSGTPAALWPDAFPAAAPAAPAAWCTIAEGGGSYLHVAVSPGHPALELGREDGLTVPPPPGPPRIG